MSNDLLIEELRKTAAFKAFDPSSGHLVRLLRVAADRLEYLGGQA